MGFLSPQQLRKMDFAFLGKNVLISDKCSIYSPNTLKIGDNSRVDDFCVLSGNISIGQNVHIAVFSNLAAGNSSITLHDFVGLAFGCHVIAQSDDYSGSMMTNPTVPSKFKKETSQAISIGRHTILGTGTIVLPGVSIPEGVSSGANTLFRDNPEPWSIYVGSPARRLKQRSQDLLVFEAEYLKEQGELLDS